MRFRTKTRNNVADFLHVVYITHYTCLFRRLEINKQKYIHNITISNNNNHNNNIIIITIIIIIIIIIILIIIITIYYYYYVYDYYYAARDHCRDS